MRNHTYCLKALILLGITICFLSACTSDSRKVRAVSDDTVRIEVDVPALDTQETCHYIEIDTQRISIEVRDTLQVIDSLIYKNGIVGKQVKYLAIHCTASRPSSQMREIVSLDWWRRARGWSRWGYHAVFFRDGTMKILNPHLRLDGIMEAREMVNGVQGLNSHTISIAYVGGCAEKLKRRADGKLELVAEDNITPEQLTAMRSFITAVKMVNPDIQIGGHRDFRAWMKKSYKSCPSFNVMDKFAEQIGVNQFRYE